jgi:hypothetical protein
MSSGSPAQFFEGMYFLIEKYSFFSKKQGKNVAVYSTSTIMFFKNSVSCLNNTPFYLLKTLFIKSVSSRLLQVIA